MLATHKSAHIIRRGVFFIFCIIAGSMMTSCVLFRPSVDPQKQERLRQKERDDALIKKYEDITGLRINKKKSLKLYKAIDVWIGTPYHYGAMTRRGTDCSGFTCNIYKEVYHKRLNRSTEDQFHKDIRRIGKWRLREGDLVFFRIEAGKKVSHVGIYLGNHKFVHASVKRGVCINDLTEKYYVDHYKKAGRVRKDIARIELAVNDF